MNTFNTYTLLNWREREIGARKNPWSCIESKELRLRKRVKGTIHTRYIVFNSP